MVKKVEYLASCRPSSEDRKGKWTQSVRKHTMLKVTNSLYRSEVAEFQNKCSYVVIFQMIIKMFILLKCFIHTYILSGRNLYVECNRPFCMFSLWWKTPLTIFTNNESLMLLGHIWVQLHQVQNGLYEVFSTSKQAPFTGQYALNFWSLFLICSPLWIRLPIKLKHTALGSSSQPTSDQWRQGKWLQKCLSVLEINNIFSLWNYKGL